MNNTGAVQNRTTAEESLCQMPPFLKKKRKEKSQRGGKIFFSQNVKVYVDVSSAV